MNVLAVRSLSINLINTVLESDVLNIGPGFLRIKLVETFSEIVAEVTIPQKLNLVIRPGDIKKHPAEETEAFMAQIYSLKPGYVSTTNHKQNYFQ